MWDGHSLRLRSGQALSVAFDVALEVGSLNSEKKAEKGTARMMKPRWADVRSQTPIPASHSSLWNSHSASYAWPHLPGPPAICDGPPSRCPPCPEYCSERTHTAEPRPPERRPHPSARAASPETPYRRQ